MTTKRVWLISFVAAGILLNPSIVSAYEIETHADISRAAANASVLVRDVSVMRDLGIKNSDEFPNSKNDGKPKSIVELIRDGARFEDSLLLARPIHHFFDPLNGAALLPVLAKSSPDWALEDKGQISFPLYQGYSFADGREAFHRALTATNPDDRNTYFGKTFEILGHVIHHVQDMAQPQHVRLDAHLKLSDADRPDWFFESGSRYEKYTKDKGGNLPFNTYPPVNHKDDTNFITTARSFWHTGQGQGLGLAEYTNRGFVSAGTNFDNPGKYPTPFFEPGTAHDENANALLQSVGLSEGIPPECLPPNEPCVMTFYGNEVKDSYRPTQTRINDRTSTWSIFDQDLKANNLTYTRTDPDTGQTYTGNRVFRRSRA